MITTLNLEGYNKLRLGYWASLQDSHVAKPEKDPLGKSVDVIYRIDHVIYDSMKTIHRDWLRLMK